MKDKNSTRTEPNDEQKEGLKKSENEEVIKKSLERKRENDYMTYTNKRQRRKQKLISTVTPSL